MDRNSKTDTKETDESGVASREGGVDRNHVDKAGLAEAEGRLPRGGRGSQRIITSVLESVPGSPPARGAWIATSPDLGGERSVRGSPPARGAWIATPNGGPGSNRRRRSPPARGAWIATSIPPAAQQDPGGRLPRGGRGSQHRHLFKDLGVGDGRLPRGGRGSQQGCGSHGPLHRSVASREGGVDRNKKVPPLSLMLAGRLPRGGRGSQPVRSRAPRRAVEGRLPRGGRGSQRY